MASSLMPEKIGKLRIVEILKKNGITDTVSVSLVEDARLVKEEFASQTLSVTVKFENSKLPHLKLFAKVRPNNPFISAMITGIKGFEKEARFFREYVPSAEKLCKEKGQLELLDIYPKCYFGDDELIVMENLGLEKGYVLHPLKDKQGLEEARAALLSLAKHHAISYAMIQKHGGKEGFMKTFQDFELDLLKKHLFSKILGPFMMNHFNTNMQLLQKNNVGGRDEALERLKFIRANILVQAIKTVEINPSDTLFLLNHGDYHNSNMMFIKDPENQKVLHHKVIDMQSVCYNSPAVDLANFLFSSVKQEVRRKHLEELLRFYSTNLRKVCEDLGHPIEYSYEDLFFQFRERFFLSFLTSFYSVVPLHSFYKDINDEIGGMSEMVMVGLYDKAIQRWVEENPEQCEEVAKEIVGLVEEFYKISFD